MSNIFQFQWAVDQSGYELVLEPGVPAADGEGFASPDWRPETQELRPISGKFRMYDPREKAINLHRELAYLASDAEALRAFTNKYGVVTGNDFSASEQACSVQSILKLKRDIRVVLDKHDQGQDAISAYYKVAEPTATFLIDPTNPNRPKMAVVPLSLQSFIWLRVVEDITGGIQWTKCKRDACPEHFSVGKLEGTKRRQFCSDKCRVYSSRERKKQEGGGG